MNAMFLFGALSDDMWPLVCLIGVAVVFVGLVAIIGLVELLTLVCNKILAKGEKNAPAKSEAPVASAPQASTAIENRGEILAAVCAAVAEEEGTDISAIRVISFKKVQ